MEKDSQSPNSRCFSHLLTSQDALNFFRSAEGVQNLLWMEEASCDFPRVSSATVDQEVPAFPPYFNMLRVNAFLAFFDILNSFAFFNVQNLNIVWFLKLR